MESNTSKERSFLRKVNKPSRYQKTTVEPGEGSDTPARAPVSSGLGHMVSPDSSIADGPQSTSRRIQLNKVAAPVNVSSRDNADFAFGRSENRAQHGPNEGEPPMVTSREATHNVFEYSRGPGNLGLNFEYNIMVIRQLEREGLIVSQFREKLLTWFCVRATEQHRRVVNTFIKTLKDDRRSLAGQLVHTFAGIIVADQ